MAISSVFDVTQPILCKWTADYETAQTFLWKLRGVDTPRRPFIGSLRGRRMRAREGVFDQFGTLLQFPPYFGENWNAFSDCVADLDWLRADAYALLVLDAEQLLVDGESDEFDVLMDVLRRAGESMAEATSLGDAKPFRVVLHAAPEHTSDLEARFRGRNLQFLGADTELAD